MNSTSIFSFSPVMKVNAILEETKDKENDSEPIRIKIRVPPIYSDKPALWFAIMEAQFTLGNIKTDELRYNYVVSYLEPEYAYMVDDIICSPPSEEKYDQLKSELIKRITESEEKKLKQRLMKEEMEDKQPSEFYQHLSELAGPQVSEEFLLEIWLSRLPGDLQKFMNNVIKPSEEPYAELADKFFKDYCRRPESPSSEAPLLSLYDVSDQIEQLSNKVEILNLKMEKISALKKLSKNTTTLELLKAKLPEPTPSQRCWYHIMYGAEAYKCVQPCNYEAEKEKPKE